MNSLQELTENIEMLSHEKSNLQDQSLMAFEEHEEKLHKIQQQEAVSCVIIFCEIYVVKLTMKWKLTVSPFGAEEAHVESDREWMWTQYINV